MANLFDCCAGFRGSKGSSTGSGSTKRRSDLAPELLARTFEEAFDRHFTPQRRPTVIHISKSFFARRCAVHTKDAPVWKRKLVIADCHLLAALVGRNVSFASSWPLILWGGRATSPGDRLKAEAPKNITFDLAAQGSAINLAEGAVHVAAIGSFAVDCGFSKAGSQLTVLRFCLCAARSDLEGRNTFKGLTLSWVPHIDDDSITIGILADHSILRAIALGKFAFAQADSLTAIFLFGALGGLPRLKFLLLAFGFCDLAKAVHART